MLTLGSKFPVFFWVLGNHAFPAFSGIEAVQAEVTVKLLIFTISAARHKHEFSVTINAECL